MFLLGVFTARALGPSGRGVFSTVTFSAVLAGAGTLSVVPAVAYFRPREHRATVGAGVGVALASGLVATTYLLAVDEIPTSAAFVPLAYATCVTTVAIVTGEALAHGSGRKLAFLYAIGPLAQATAVGFALALGMRDVPALLWIWVAGFACVAIGALAWIRIGSSTRRLGELFRYMAAAAASNLLWSLGARVELFALAAIAPPEEVGLYAVAVAPAQALTVLASAYTSSVYGRLRGPPDQVKRTMGGVVARLTAAEVLAAGVLAAPLPVLLPLIYGSDFDDSVAPALIVVAAALLLAPASLLVAYFNNTLGRPGLGSIVAAFGLLSALGVAAGLAASLGAEGAALGSLAGSVASLVIAVYFFYTAAPNPARHEEGDEEAETGQERYASPRP